MEYLYSSYFTMNNFIPLCHSHQVSKYITDEDVEKDGTSSFGEKIHYRENFKRPGYVIYTVRRNCIIQVSIHILIV